MRTSATCSAPQVQCSAHHMCNAIHTFATPPQPHKTNENAQHICHDRCFYFSLLDKQPLRGEPLQANCAVMKAAQAPCPPGGRPAPPLLHQRGPPAKLWAPGVRLRHDQALPLPHWLKPRGRNGSLHLLLAGEPQRLQRAGVRLRLMLLSDGRDRGSSLRPEKNQTACVLSGRCLQELPKQLQR